MKKRRPSRAGRLVGMTTSLAPAVTLMAVLVMATVHLPTARARDIPLIKNAEDRVVADAGSTVLLPCLAEGEPEPMVEWYRGHQQVTGTWARFRITHRGLRIKQSAPEDSGHYVCKAINGFGTAQIKIELVVTGEPSNTNNGNIYEDMEPPSILRPPPLTGTKPIVTPATRQRTLQRPREAAVRLRCDVSGDPPPKIHWLKDGRPLLMSSYDETQPHPPRLGRYTLPLDNLVPEDSGVYMCLAQNSFGTANASFTLEVVDRLKKKPEMTGLDPLNTTVLRGDTASFQCRVRSQVPPSIQWLKRIDGEEARQANTTIVLHGERYRVLKANDVLAHSNGEYLNKLVIPHAMPSHAGMYVCWGASSMGYNIRSAFLTVRSPPEVKHHPNDKSNPTTSFTRFPIALFIVVPMAVVIFSAVVAICFLRRRRRQRSKTIRQPRTSTVPPQPPPPSTMPPLLPMRRSSPCPPPLFMRDVNPGCRSWSPPACAYPGPPPSLRSEATSIDSRPLPQQRPLLLNY